MSKKIFRSPPQHPELLTVGNVPPDILTAMLTAIFYKAGGSTDREPSRAKLLATWRKFRKRDQKRLLLEARIFERAFKCGYAASSPSPGRLLMLNQDPRSIAPDLYDEAVKRAVYDLEEVIGEY